MKKLLEAKKSSGEPIPLEKAKIFKTGQIANTPFRVFATDNLNIVLEIDGHKTYHRDLLGTANSLKAAVQRILVHEKGENGISSLSELIEVFQNAEKEFEECWK